MNNKLKYNGLTALGALLCIAPPAVATLCYFPVWVEKSSSATVSGLSLILILISIIPLFRIIKEHIASPSITLIWVIVCVFCIAFKAIIDQILVISFVGALSSIAGTIVFKARPKEDKQGAEKEKE